GLSRSAIESERTELRTNAKRRASCRKVRYRRCADQVGARSGAERDVGGGGQIVVYRPDGIVRHQRVLQQYRRRSGEGYSSRLAGNVDAVERDRRVMEIDVTKICIQSACLVLRAIARDRGVFQGQRERSRGLRQRDRAAKSSSRRISRNR